MFSLGSFSYEYESILWYQTWGYVAQQSKEYFHDNACVNRYNFELQISPFCNNQLNILRCLNSLSTYLHACKSNYLRYFIMFYLGHLIRYILLSIRKLLNAWNRCTRNFKWLPTIIKLSNVQKS